jgi:hypothetical protein
MGPNDTSFRPIACHPSYSDSVVAFRRRFKSVVARRHHFETVGCVDVVVDVFGAVGHIEARADASMWL